MPGRLLRLTRTQAVGWAAHSRLGAYRVVVHVAHRAVILRSALAELALPGELTHGVPPSSGFTVDLAVPEMDGNALDRLRFSIGETDERIEMPVGWPAAPPAAAPLTVEDILAEAQGPRAWVAGTTYVDAAAAGLRAETIIDLIYRDYLGRPSDPNGLAHYADAVRRGVSSYDDIRRTFIESGEYRTRRKHLDRAPGSIFSQGIVMAVATADIGRATEAASTGQSIVASDLVRLDGPAFVAALYRRILLKEPDEAGMAHYLHQLHQGVSKVTVIRTIAGELEAITAGVRVVDYPIEAA